MLYTTQTRPFPERKSRPSRANDSDGFFDEFTTAAARNLCITFNRKTKQNHGRKGVLQQGRETQNKIGSSPLPHRSMHSSEAGANRGTHNKQNQSIYEHSRAFNVKRHTHNYHYISQREEESENQLLRTNHTIVRSKKTTVPVEKETGKAYQRRQLKERLEQTQKQQEMDENDGDFLQPKKNLYRKISIHNKLTPIDFNEMLQKPSLVDLIRKFKFQNLKTTSLNESSNSINQYRKYADSKFVRDYSKQKTHPFFRQQPSQFQNRKLARKASRQLKKDEVRNNQKGMKKTNPILSPWGTIGDNFLHQSPAG